MELSMEIMECFEDKSEWFLKSKSFLKNNCNTLKLLSKYNFFIIKKNNYFSRRDQYKVSELLREKTTHVYARKIIYFESTKV